MTALVRAAALLLTLCCVAPRYARADAASEQGGELYSIEKRRLMGSHEISISIGTLPLDAFGKGLTVQGNYTYHFSHLVGWELIGGTYSFVIGTGLDDQLRDRFDAQSEAEGDLEAFIHSDVVFKPLYGKIAWLNDKLLAAELFFTLGPALGFFTDQSRPVGANVGFGLRFFLGRYFSARFEMRDYMFFPDFSDFRNHLYISLGLGLTFGFSDTDSNDE